MITEGKIPDFSGMTKSDQIISSVGDGVTVHDRNFRIIYQNQTMKSIFGECVGELCYEAYQQLSAICPACPVAACFSTGEVHTVERVVSITEKTFVFETCASPIHDMSGNIVASVEVVRNATKRKEEQYRIAKLKNLFEAISRVNKAIMFNKDKDKLFQEICRILVKHGKLSQAEIDIQEQAGFAVPTARCGTETIYVPTDRGKAASCADDTCSSAELPLIHEGKSFGLLRVFSDQKSFFDQEVIDQLQEIAISISFAIENHANEEVRKKAEEALRGSEERLRLVLDGSDYGYWNWDVTTGGVDLSPRFMAMLGCPPGSGIATISGLLKLVHPADRTRMRNIMYGRVSRSASGFELELRVIKKTKAYEWLLCRGKVVSCDGQGAPLLMSGVVRTITERKRHEEELQYKCTHDQLTGLYNRAYFDAEMVRVEQSRQYPVSVVVADVDGLKCINDSFGHSEGDRIIRQAARVLQQSFRGDDVVARIGGDEFAAILQNTDAGVVQEATRRILQFQADINGENSAYTLSLSFGSATAERRNQLNEALKQADSRMYDYKFRRKSSYVNLADSLQTSEQKKRRQMSGLAS
ncbi:MAG: diguanylate cyclase [Desulfuromonadaceae bacterium]|nr:diguanylate cyclase [Desulfuromonadaceae bacterium]